MAALLNVKQFVRFDEHGNLHVPNKLFVACQAYVQTPFLNDTSSRVATTEWVRAQISSLTGVSVSETDPIWVFEKALYYTKLQADARYLQSFTETDPTVSAWAKASVKPSYAYSELTGLPTLFSGSYTDLTNKPTIPTYTLSGLGGQPLDADLTAIAALAGTAGFLKKTAADTWALDNSTYLTSYTETDPIWTAEKTNYALKTYVDTSISNLVASAPATLNTLNELALALGSDANFSTTVTTLIGTKEPSITAGTTLQYFRGDKTFQTLPIYTLSGLGGEPTIAAGTTAQYWRGDKSWQTLPTYNLSLYVPTSRTLTINGSAYDLSADRAWTITTASTYTLPIATSSVLGGIKVGTNLSIDANGVLSSTDTNTTYVVFTRSANGLTPAAPAGTGTTKYLREDGTWQVPPDTDTNTTYSAGTGLTLSGTTFSVTKTITAAQTADTIALRNGDGQLVATGFYQASSRSLKTNISPFTKSALDIIRDVTVVSFNYKTDIINKHVGFIAEDTPEELSTRHKNVMDSNNTIGVLLKAVQELEARIKQLESK